MLYKPKFCAECGGKIERVEWNLLTSRKFCANCAAYLAPISSLWKPIAAILTIFISGVFIGQFGQSKKTPVVIAASQDTQNVANQKIEPAKVIIQNTPNQNQQTRQNFVAQNPQQNQTISPVQTKQTPQTTIPMETTESVYFCGAMTKKGTPCSRRVKGGGRCWQHIGQGAMLPENKLLIQ